MTQKFFSTTKKVFLTLIACLLLNCAMAQVPAIINYQAVARNNAGAALANQTIKVRLSIINNGSVLYSETRQVTTNLLGLFNVQIGSPNPLIVVGDLETVDWITNPAPGHELKVEIDINNSNVFTDMGSQRLVSVPFALQSQSAADAKIALKAIEVVNINGSPVDTLTVPTAGDRLAFDGNKWTTVKKDTVMTIAGAISNIPVTAGNPWVFVGPTKTITVTGTETIVGHFSATFGQSGASGVLVSVGVCYENVSGGGINAFHPTIFPDVTILASPTKTMLSAHDAVKLPAGTYKIGMAVKNKSIATVLNANDNVVGTIDVKY